VFGVWGRRVSCGPRHLSPPWVAVAAAGVVVGHLLTYLIAIPHAHEREALLRETGHSYFPVLAQLALLAGAVALGALFLRQLTGIGWLRSRPMSLFARLACTQVGAFAAMEVAERLVSGAPLAELVHDHIFVGLLVQVAIAWLGARVIEALSRAADRVRASLASLRRVRALISLDPPRREPIAAGFVPVAAARAPPLVSFAAH
jgi:hypothetical protein